MSRSLHAPDVHRRWLPVAFLPLTGWLIAVTDGSESPLLALLAVHFVLAALQSSRRWYLLHVGLIVATAALPLAYEHDPHHSFLLTLVLGNGVMAGGGWLLHSLWRQLRRMAALDRLRALEQSEQEQKFRSLFEQNPDPVVAIDLEGRFTRVNHAATQMLGLPKERLIGCAFEGLLRADSGPLVAEAYRAALSGVPQRYEAVVRAADGREVAVEASSAPILVGGEVVGVFTVCKDVTPLRAAKQELRHKEDQALRLLEQQRLALAAGRMAVWETDLRTDDVRWQEIPEGEATVRLRAFARARTAAEWLALIHPDDVEGFLLARESALVSGDDFNAEFRLSLPDGTTAWAAASARVVESDERGNPLVLYGVIADITDRRAAEEELRLREEQLRQAQQLEALGQLAGGIAHDFNNILTAILGFSELLELRLDGEAEEVVQIRQAGERARKLVNQLLAFSRRPVDTGVVDVNEGVQGVIDLLDRLIGEHIVLRTHIAPGLGVVRLDGAQLEQIVLNLAVNARDAMAGGGELLLRAERVELAAGEVAALGIEPGEYVRLLVRDSGVGMPPEVMAHVFEPFYTTKPEGKGTGMGMATVYGIVTGARGHIRVDSHPGQGTTVIVDLPLTDDAATAMDAPVEAVLDQSAQGTILLVEDQGQIRTLVRQALTRRGYRVLTAVDGRAALDVVDQHGEPIDLLLTDVVMPQMNGVELAERLRAQQPGLPVLFMSGYAKGETMREGVSSEERQGFIQKPFTLGALLDDVERLLEGRVRAA